MQLTLGARDIGTVISMKKTLGIEVPSRELSIIDQASIVNEGNSCFNITMLCQKSPGVILITNDIIIKNNNTFNMVI